MSPSAPLTLRFEELSSKDLQRVGGKGANLGELAAAGFPVPPGFCVTTAAFDAFLTGCQGLPQLFDRLDTLDGKDPAAARELAEATRAVLGQAPIPPAVSEAILSAWRQATGAAATWAVRSSATAEDLPDASFAGQQDTYLNVRGPDALLDAVRRCWASLFTDRAVLYRARNRYGHREVKLSVVVQRMVLPEVSGILFTADPVSGSRGTVSIEAGFGLGEALVGGLINADLYRVDKATGALLEVRVGDKALAIRPRPEGGTFEEALPAAQRTARSLDDATVQALAAVGNRIEQHYRQPQDVEWCIEAGRLFVVQTRPITSLYPLPVPAPADGGLHAYASFGHVQMMTHPMPPLALQLWRLMLPVDRPPRQGAAPPESRAVTTAGSRVFLDLTSLLRHPLIGRGLRQLMGQVYPDMGEGLAWVRARADFQRGARQGRVRLRSLVGFVLPILRRAIWRLLVADPNRLRIDGDRFSELRAGQARRRLAVVPPGAARLREARELLSEMFAGAFLKVAPSIPVGFAANALLHRLVGRGNPGGDARDLAALERGLPGNVTTEMDLAVGDLIDRIRPYPALVGLLQTRPPRQALAMAAGVEGGAAFLEAWEGFLRRYGMRGPGEVDLSRPRYRDDPGPLVSTLLGSVGTHRAPGEHRARHAALAAEADAAIERLSRSARHGLLGALRSRLVRRLARLARAGLAMREHPKFLMVRILEPVREAVLEAGTQLVERGELELAEDAFLFRFEELLAALEAPGASGLRSRAAERREVLRRDAQRAPPFMMTSQGEIPALAVRTDLPPGSLAGTAASAGVVEGRARVVLDPGTEVLLDGEILVAPHTDPGWTPLFVHAAGLVTEVGGLITHGSVVAREYGIPAVVSVRNATSRIRTGQRIRVDGSRGIVELLEGESP